MTFWPLMVHHSQLGCTYSGMWRTKANPEEADTGTGWFRHTLSPKPRRVTGGTVVQNTMKPCPLQANALSLGGSNGNTVRQFLLSPVMLTGKHTCMCYTISPFTSDADWQTYMHVLYNFSFHPWCWLANIHACVIQFLLSPVMLTCKHTRMFMFSPLSPLMQTSRYTPLSTCKFYWLQVPVMLTKRAASHAVEPHARWRHHAPRSTHFVIIKGSHMEWNKNTDLTPSLPWCHF